MVDRGHIDISVGDLDSRVPLEGVAITLSNSAATQTFKTDRSGHAVIDVPFGTYLVQVEHDGYFGPDKNRRNNRCFGLPTT